LRVGKDKRNERESKEYDKAWPHKSVFLNVV
jgi:hypothetical protein